MKNLLLMTPMLSQYKGEYLPLFMQASSLPIFHLQFGSKSVDSSFLYSRKKMLYNSMSSGDMLPSSSWVSYSKGEAQTPQSKNTTLREISSVHHYLIGRQLNQLNQLIQEASSEEGLLPILFWSQCANKLQCVSFLQIPSKCINLLPEQGAHVQQKQIKKLSIIGKQCDDKMRMELWKQWSDYIILGNMGEVIQIQIGQAGHRIGYSFWEELVQEHCLDNSGQLIDPTKDDPKRHVYFDEHTQNVYRARSIFADMDSHSIDNIYQSQLSSIFPYQNSCYDIAGTRNLWPIGHGADTIKQDVLDVVRKEAEKCDRLSAFNIVHSICGGSGSGLGSLILQKLQEQFRNSIITTISGCPSPNISNIIVEPYNTLLALQKLCNLKSQPSILFENQALFNFNKKNAPHSRGSYLEINKLLSVALANLTSPSRFPCDGNVTWRKLACNMLEFPSRKFLTMSMPYLNTFEKDKVGNIVKHETMAYKNWSVSLAKKIVRKIFKHKWVTNYFVFRGSGWSSFDVNCRIALELNRKVNYNKIWKDDKIARQIPHSYLACVVKAAPHREGNVVTSLQNSSMVREFLTQFHDRVTKLLHKKSFMHHYASEGLEMDHFNEAQSCLMDTLSQYQVLVEEIECYGEEHDYYE